MIASKVFKILWLLFLIEIAASRTVTHYETKIDSDGNKITRTYTSTDNNDAPHTPNHLIQYAGTSSEPYQTFNRNGATIRIKPQTETIRIGGTGIPTEELIKQAGLIKGVDPTAVRELLDTMQPVTRSTSDENGQKRTSTYKLEPDGSISIRSVAEVSPKEVDEQFRNLFANNNKANADPLAKDAEWTSLSEPIFNTRFNRPSTSWRTDPNLFLNTNIPTNSWPKFEDIPVTNYMPKEETTTIRLPETWDPTKWHSTKTFTSSNFPTIFDHDDGEDDLKLNPFDSTNVTPGTKTTTYIDDNGSKVTTTYTVQPTKWTHKTFNSPPITWADREETTPPTTTTTTTTTTKRNPIPNLDDFLRSQYDTTTKINDLQHLGDNRTFTRVKLDELPIMEVLNTNNNNNHPIDEDFVRTIPSELRPIVGPRTPIRTIKIENIPRTEDDATVETTKIQSLTKTVHTNTLPTSAHLDPSMRDILQKAGINPDDIRSTSGNTITKSRLEPDGHVVTTTYRVRTVPPPAVGAPTNTGGSGNSVGRGTNRQSPPFNELTDPDDATGSTNFIPTRSTFHAAPTPTPTHFSSSHTYSKFPPTFGHPVSTPHHSRRDYLQPQPLPSGRSEINDFLAKIGLRVNDILNQNGELIKTIVDDDGRILTATFLLSSVKQIPADDANVLKKHSVEQKPIK